MPPARVIDGEMSSRNPWCQKRILNAVGSSNGWRRLSDYAIRKGHFIIGKAIVGEKAIYTLTSDDLSIIERFDSADAARARAEEFLSGNGRPADWVTQAHPMRPTHSRGLQEACK